MCSEAEYQPFAEMHWQATRNSDVSIDMPLLLLLIQSCPQRFCWVWDTDSTLCLGKASRDEEDWAEERNWFWTQGRTHFCAQMAPGQQKQKQCLMPSADPGNVSQSTFILTLFLSKALCSRCWMHSCLKLHKMHSVKNPAWLAHLFLERWTVNPPGLGNQCWEKEHPQSQATRHSP